MSLPDHVIDALVDSGCTAQQIAAAVKASNAADETRREAKRAGNAERQRRFRQSQSNADNALHAVTDCDGVTSGPFPAPPMKENLTPPPIPPDITIPARKAGDFPKPDWADAQVWTDWLDIRKAKKCRNTATAHAGFLSDIADHTDENWPPGELLRHAVRKSWASIHKPDEKQNGRPLRPADNLASLRGNRPNPAFDMVLAAERELQAEAQRENPQPDWQARAALPSH